jgi:uncharacterized membrane protein required for colicin V production
MTLPLSFLPMFNLIIIGFVVLMLIYGFFKGFLLQIFSIVMFIAVCFVSWMIAPALAKAIPLMQANEQFNVLPIIGPLFQNTINTVFWFIIIVFGLMVLSFFFKPVLKGIGKLPILKTVNRILGLLLAGMKAFFVLILLAMLLNSGWFINGQAYVSKSLLNQLAPITNMAVNAVSAQFDSSGLVAKIMTGQSFSESETFQLETWLSAQSIPSEVVPVLSKLLRLQSISPIEMSLLIDWMRANGISEADINTFMENFK